ncbi:MAG TPA: cytosine permease, partial [Caballeronia sp.]|nr:cytosine permease [Caballeronia sp.]
MASSRTSNSARKVETRGIEPVPEGECHGHPLQLFWVWFAANISILGLPLGATLVAFQHLAIWQAALVAVIGAAGSFAIVGVISIAGRRGHAPSLTLSRAIFGVRGNIGPTIVSLLSRLGWETVNTTTAAYVLLSLATIVFGTPAEAKNAPVLTLVFIAVFVVLTL